MLRQLLFYWNDIPFGVSNVDDVVRDILCATNVQHEQLHENKFFLSRHREKYYPSLVWWCFYYLNKNIHKFESAYVRCTVQLLLSGNCTPQAES